MLVLVAIGAFMLVVDLLNLLIHFLSILAHGYLLVILSWSRCADSLLFVSLGMMMLYNCSNTCLYIF
jgi:cadmium resistance protein CadD (predicted permease)